MSIDPGAAFVLIVLVVIVTTGNRGASYIADPSLIPQAWKPPVAGVVAVVVGLSTATLMSLIYGMIMFRDHSGVRRFVQAVGQYTAVGAVLGALWGLRTAAPLVDLSLRARADGPEFVEFLSIVSNTVTLMTLAFVAACWWRIWAFFRAQEISGWQQWAVRFVVLIGNYFGLRAGWAAWQMLT